MKIPTMASVSDQLLADTSARSRKEGHLEMNNEGRKDCLMKLEAPINNCEALCGVHPCDMFVQGPVHDI